jgi:hypothetical protein
LIALEIPEIASTASSTAPVAVDAIQSSPQMSVRSMTVPSTNDASNAEIAAAASRLMGETRFVKSSSNPIANTGRPHASSSASSRARGACSQAAISASPASAPVTAMPPTRATLLA